MFKENLKVLRKQKGFTQEEVAIRLHVVRQTVSKWEKGLSIPDADMLIQLADILEVSVSDLLGRKIVEDEDVDVLAEQLARINEQLALANKNFSTFIKTIGNIALVTITLLFLASIFDSWNEMWYEFGGNI